MKSCQRASVRKLEKDYDLPPGNVIKPALAFEREGKQIYRLSLSLSLFTNLTCRRGSWLLNIKTKGVREFSNK